jgi:hypothetical protein
MLSKLGSNATECHRRAAEAKQLADLATSARDREFYEAREQDWLNLAQSYELSERLDLTIHEKDRQRSATQIQPCPACRQATPIHYRTMFVCTSCNLVFEADKPHSSSLDASLASS